MNEAEQAETGALCQKGNPGCYCRVGWPLHLQCPDCRGDEGDRRQSYCVCPPDPEKFKLYKDGEQRR